MLNVYVAPSLDEESQKKVIESLRKFNQDPQTTCSSFRDLDSYDMCVYVLPLDTAVAMDVGYMSAKDKPVVAFLNRCDSLGRGLIEFDSVNELAKFVYFYAVDKNKKTLRSYSKTSLVESGNNGYSRQ